ncbi:MAG TPA: NDP-sugar synthase [Candidatus Deferrimicrobiaceae bacterium]|nr:NDP-sugar synthase [Candidatus Deferrimicrobiaceae bacterium]
MVLAAGLGTRLRPLSYELPKPVIPVLGRPLCTYNMEFLRRAGIKTFVLNLHTNPKLIQQRVSGWAGRTARVDFTLEPVILGTGGGIWNAREFLKDGTFVTMNGDTIVSFPFRPALAFHRKKKALATLVLFPDPAKRYTPVWVGEEGRITGFGREPGEGARSGFYTGCQIVEPELLSRIPPGKASCIIRETYAPLVAGGAPVFGWISSGRFHEFGTPADYLAGTMALLSAKKPEASSPDPADGGPAIIPPVHISPRAKIAPGARIGPEAVIEDGATVAEGASVSRSILWPGAVLPAGEELFDAILTPRRRVQVG